MPLVLIAGFWPATALAQIHGPERVEVGKEHCAVHVASWDRLNVRGGPSARAAVVTTHRYGECGITVTGECRDGWCPVEDGHFAGWVSEKYIAVVNPPFYCGNAMSGETVMKLRAYPSDISRVVAEISSATCDIAALPYGVGKWQKVRVDGYEGWIEYSELYAQ